MIMSLKQKEINFKPSIKLNHNTVTKKTYGQVCIVFVELAKIAAKQQNTTRTKTICYLTKICYAKHPFKS